MILFESERRVLDVLWAHGSMKAAELAKMLEKSVGWSRNTTYTVLKKCVDKELIKRNDPGYIVSPLITRRQIQREEVEQLLEGSFGGSVTRLLSAVLDVKSVSRYEVKEIKRLLAKSRPGLFS